MIRRIGWGFVGCVLLAQCLEAETERTRQIGIGFGSSWVRSKDDLFSLFTYNGDGRVGLIQYRSQSSKSHHYISLTAGASRLTSPITPSDLHKIEAYRTQIRYTYRRYFQPNSPKRIRFLWGIVQQAFVHFRLPRGKTQNEYFGEGLGSVQPLMALQLEWTAKSSLTYELSVPALTFLLLNTYSYNLPDVDFQLTSLHRFLGAEHSLGWMYKIGDESYVQIQYWGLFYRYITPRTTSTNRIGIDQLSGWIYWEF